MVQWNELVHCRLCIRLMTEVLLMVRWRGWAERTHCASREHILWWNEALGQGGGHKTHRRVHRRTCHRLNLRGSLGTKLVGLMCDRSQCWTYCLHLERPVAKFVERTKHLGKANERRICRTSCHKSNCRSETQRVIANVIAKGSSYGLQQGEVLGCVGRLVVT